MGMHMVILTTLNVCGGDWVVALISSFYVAIPSPFVESGSLISEYSLVRSSEVRKNSTKCAPNFQVKIKFSMCGEEAAARCFREKIMRGCMIWEWLCNSHAHLIRAITRRTSHTLTFYLFYVFLSILIEQVGERKLTKM
ncbi:hypothetical protein BGZ60DRAFT_12465 [Tricladium varicosporioides]|nr:hypothetical protein BGZ60DRAFT_12465 [Hymenoscyphus varicosporioides]